MAAITCFAEIEEVALVAATPKTVIQIYAPVNQRVKVLGWGVFFKGVNTADAPVKISVMRQLSAGTMSALTPVPIVPITETIQTYCSSTATAEPTYSDKLDGGECHPQQGYEVKFPMGQELILGGGGRLGIVCTAPAAVSVTAKLYFEE